MEHLAPMQPGIGPKKPSDQRFLQVIARLMDREGYKSNRQFLAAHGYNHALINKIKAGLQSAPADVVAELAEQYQINLNFIYLGQPPMFLGEVAGPGLQQYSLPLLMANAAASFTEAFLDDYQHQPTTTMQILAAAPPPPGALALEVAGNSMASQLQDGTRLLAEPVLRQDWHYLPSGVYAVHFSTSLTVKRVKDNGLLREGLLTLHSDNPQYGSLSVKAEDLHKIWRITGLLQGEVR